MARDQGLAKPDVEGTNRLAVVANDLPEPDLVLSGVEKP
jgi:hypothetical protein